VSGAPPVGPVAERPRAVAAYTVDSTNPADRPTLERLAPGIHSLRVASGIALDIAPHLRGEAQVVDRHGQVVPAGDWLPELLATRGQQRRR
jgi:hypothetical protein